MPETIFHTTFSTSHFSLSRTKNGSESGLRSAVSYRFGFNGQEMDNEITGSVGTHTTATFWEYDTRLGRRWNVDPVMKEYESPYLCFSGNPIWFSDPNGDNAWHPDKDGSLVADPGDNEFTLTDYLHQNHNVNVGYGKAKELMQKMYHGTPISNIAGHRIKLSDIRKVLGSHTSTMMNPGTRSVHEGHEKFMDPLFGWYIRLENRINNKNHDAVKTHDAYPKKSPDSPWFDQYFEGNTNPNVSDQNYSDGYFSGNGGDPMRTQNRPNKKSGTDSIDIQNTNGNYTRYGVPEQDSNGNFNKNSRDIPKEEHEQNPYPEKF